MHKNQLWNLPLTKWIPMSASIQSATDLSLINFLYFGWTLVVSGISPSLTSLILSFKNCSLPSKFDPSLILCQSEESIIWNKVTFDLWCSRGTRKPETRKENPTWTQFLVTILPKNPENRETEFLDFGTLQIVPEPNKNRTWVLLDYITTIDVFILEESSWISSSSRFRLTLKNQNFHQINFTKKVFFKKLFSDIINKEQNLSRNSLSQSTSFFSRFSFDWNLGGFQFKWGSNLFEEIISGRFFFTPNVNNLRLEIREDLYWVR